MKVEKIYERKNEKEKIKKKKEENEGGFFN